MVLDPRSLVRQSRRLSFLLVFILSSCGGFQSVENLEKIKPPKDFEDIDIETTQVPAPSEKEEAKEPTLISKVKEILPKTILPKKKSYFEEPHAIQRKNMLIDKSPFRVGEKTTYKLTWFAIKAGEVTMEVHPFAYVNDRKAYHFLGSVKSSSVMDLIHSIDDWMESYVDTDTFYPFKAALHGIETDRLREGRTIFNYDKRKVSYWMKRVHVGKGTKEKQATDKIFPGMVDIFSSAYYLRTLPLKVGKKYQADLYYEGKRYVVNAMVLGREKFETEFGLIDTIVVRPTAKFEGQMQTSGDTKIWFTDDDRRFLVQLETKVKIGYLMGKVKTIEDMEYVFPPKK